MGWARLIRIARVGLWVLLPLVVAGCGFSSILESDPGERGQPFPSSYKSELLAFFRSYLKDPVAVRDAAMAEPVQRNVGGQPRFVSCLKLNARESDGTYRGVQVRGVLFNKGRLDRVIEDLGDICAGATYAPFPELEKLSR